jgi:protein-tyrosine phosphatase
LAVISALNSRMESHYASFRGWVRLMLAKAEFHSGRLNRYANVDFTQVHRLVFVCQGNVCRSCFAEYVARGLGVRTASFGLQAGTGERAFPRAREAAKAFEIDLGPHRVTDIDDFHLQPGDLLATMEVRQARRLSSLIDDPTIQITLVGLWSDPFRPHVHDPFEHDDAYFATCFQTLRSGVRTLVSRWRGAAESRCAG